MSLHFASTNWTGRGIPPPRRQLSRARRNSSSSEDEHDEMFDAHLTSAARFAASTRANEIEIAMQDLGWEYRDRMTGTDAGPRVRVVPAHRLFADRECNQEGTEAAEIAAQSRGQLAQWGNYGNTPDARADVEKLPDLNGGQSHREKLQKAIAEEKARNGGKLDWEAADGDHSRRRPNGARGNHSSAGGRGSRGGRGNYHNVGSRGPQQVVRPRAASRPLDPAVEPGRDYVYKTKSGGKTVSVPYSGSSPQSGRPALTLNTPPRGTPNASQGGKGGGKTGRGGIQHSTRSPMAGNVDRLGPLSTANQPVPRPRRNASTYDLPTWILVENPVAGPFATTVDKAIAAAIAKSPALSQAPSKASGSVTGILKASQSSATELTSTRPIATITAQSIPPKPAPTDQLSPVVSSAGTQKNQTASVVDRLASDAFMDAYHRMQEAKSLEKRIGPAPCSKASQLADKQTSTVNTALALPNSYNKNIKKVSREEIMFPPPNRSDARLGEASSWTDGKPSPVSSGALSAFNPSPVAPEETTIPDTLPLEQKKIGLGIWMSIPARAEVKAEGDSMPHCGNLATLANGEAVDLMDVEAEQVSQPALQPSLPHWAAQRKIIDGIPYLMVREDQITSIQQRPPGSRSVPTPTVAKFAQIEDARHQTASVQPSDDDTVGARGLVGARGTLFSNHNFPRRPTDTQQAGHAEESQWADTGKERGFRDRQPRLESSHSIVSADISSVGDAAPSTVTAGAQSLNHAPKAYLKPRLTYTPAEMIAIAMSVEDGGSTPCPPMTSNSTLFSESTAPVLKSLHWYLSSVRGDYYPSITRTITIMLISGVVGKTKATVGTAASLGGPSSEAPAAQVVPSTTPASADMVAPPIRRSNPVHSFGGYEYADDIAGQHRVSGSDLVTPFVTAAPAFSQDVEMSGLGQVEAAVFGGEQLILQETSAERAIRMMDVTAGPGAGMTPFGGRALQPSGRPATHSVASHTSSSRLQKNLKGSKYATDTTLPTPLGVLSNNGTSPRKQKATSNWVDTKESSSQPHNIRNSATPIFGDSKTLQRKNYKTGSPNIFDASAAKPFKKIAPGAGFERLLKELGEKKLLEFTTQGPALGLRGGAGNSNNLAATLTVSPVIAPAGLPAASQQSQTVRAAAFYGLNDDNKTDSTLDSEL